MAGSFSRIANIIGIVKFTRDLINASRHYVFGTERILKAFDNPVTELIDLEKLLKSVQDHFDSNPSSLVTVLDGWISELVGLNKPKDRGWFREWFEWDRR
jgi:hypothetical protein